MREMSNCVKVRCYQMAIDDLEKIASADFSFVVCNAKTEMDYPVLYFNAFTSFHHADAFCTLLNDKQEDVFDVYSVDELAYRLDCKICEIIEGDEID